MLSQLVTRIGRFLQVFGLFVVPLAIPLQLLPWRADGSPLLSLGQMLAWCLGGCCLFYLGRLMQAYGGSADAESPGDS